MSEERSTTEDRIAAQLDRIAGDVGELKAGQARLIEAMGAMAERVSRLEGGFEQMDKRIGNVEARMATVESLQRWNIGLTVTVLLALVAGLILPVVTKLP